MVACAEAGRAEAGDAADKVPLPSTVAPSLNCTVPVAAFGETIAVKVTDWPLVDGLAEDDNVVVVDAELTVWLTAALVLAPKVAFPP